MLDKSTIVILFTVLCGTFCEVNLSAYMGQTANIECAYAAENIFNAKYFFKMSAGRNIKSIYTLKSRKFLHDGRVSMSDDLQRRILSISIDALSESDSGLYACAVGKGHNLETFSVVRLSVMTAPQIQVNIDKPSVPTVRSFLNPSSETSENVMVTGLFTTALSAVTEMSKEKEVLTVLSDWRWIALFVGSSVLIVAVLSCGLMLICRKLRRKSLQHRRHRKQVSKWTDNSQNKQKPEYEHNKLHVYGKCQDSIYQDLNKKQSDPIYQCLNDRNNQNHYHFPPK